MKKLIKILKKKTKHLGILSFLISSFFFVSSVKAFNLNIDYENENMNALKDNLSVVNHLIDLEKQYNEYDLNYVISFYKKSSSYFIVVGMSTCSSYYINYSAYYNPSYAYYYNGSTIGTSSVLNAPVNNNKCYLETDNKIQYYELNLSSYTNDDLNNFYENVKSLFDYHNFSKFSTYAPQVAQAYTNKEYLTNNNFLIPVFSNKKMIYLQNKSSKETDTIKIGDVVYNYLDDFPTYADLYMEVANNPEIIFSVDNLTDIEGNIYQKKLTIDYGYIDNDKYIYMYKFNDENYWNTVYLISSTSKIIDIYKNRTVIAQILDKNTYDVIDSKTYMITNINNNFSIDFSASTLTDDWNNTYLTNVTINYNAINRDLYNFQYTIDEENWITLENNATSTLVQTSENINIIARILEKSSGNVVKTSTYKVIQNLEKPKITFKLASGNILVEKAFLTINFGLMNNEKYGYMWKYYDEDTWNTVYLTKTSVELEISKNTTIIAQVINKSDNSIVTNSSFLITTIVNMDDYDHAPTNFFTAVKYSFDYFANPFREIFKMINYFWLGLNSSIQYFIIFIFAMIVALFLFKFIL